VRRHRQVVTAVANGDLKQNLTVKSKGEVAALADTINNMTRPWQTFADQVSSVAREVASRVGWAVKPTSPARPGRGRILTATCSTCLRPI